MVKFGRHVQFYSEHENTDNHCIVPYKSICDKIPHFNSGEERFLEDPISEDAKQASTICCIKFFSLLNKDNRKNSTEEFENVWRQGLNKAITDFKKKSQSRLQTIYQGVSSIPEARGGTLETVLRMYIPSVGIDASQDLLVFLKGLRSVAHLNSEALVSIKNQ